MLMRRLGLLLLVLFIPVLADAQDTSFSRMDVFDLEWVTSPQISPDGAHIVYERRGMDVMDDQRTSSLWLMEADGSNHVKLTDRDVSESSPRWSPDGSQIAYIGGTEDDGAQIFIHTLEPRSNVQHTQLDNSPSGLSWSPDGSHLAFTMHVDADAPQLVSPPDAPEGADWAEPPRVETRLNHEQDGSGIRPFGHDHLFVVRADADGGPVRQLTDGDYDHSGPATWTADGSALIVSANRHDDAEREYRNTELYRVALDDGSTTPLTDRFGPDYAPRISPDGETVAYLGYDDEVQTYQLTRLYTMNPDGSGVQAVDTGLERSINSFVWDEEGAGFYVQYDDQGVSHLAHIAADGKVTDAATDLGGTAVGRPYTGSADFSVANDGTIAINQSNPYRPAELATTARGQDATRLTDLNGALMAQRTLGQVETMRYPSTEDGRDLQGWVVTPPDYDPDRTYPLLVEIHGGPIGHYGPHFAPEIQLYAAAGYVVFYPNARGSTSYGAEFGNLLKNDFSGGEYQDIMYGVNELVAEGTVSEDSLYVTGGSAGGTSAAWITGQTDRFQAAAIQKPVINWISKTLAADNHYAYANYRYPGQPWQNPMDYWDVSPISLMESVNTPSIVIVGQEDLRTPTWEAKQWYHGLKLRGVDAMYVEMPGAYHFIANRPSQLISKVDHVLAWFERYR